MPFTSTALIASSLGLNSVYYDVTQSLNQLDYVEDEVTFISGKTELKKEDKSKTRNINITQIHFEIY